MKKFNKIRVIILIVTSLILTIGFVLIQIYSPNLKNLALIGYLVCTLVLMYSIQSIIFHAMSKRQYKKIKNIRYTIPSFDLEAKGFINRRTRYGNSFIKIEDLTVYRVNLIDNYQAFFDNDKNSIKMSNSLKEKLNACKKMITYDIYRSIDEESLHKIMDLNQLEGKIMLSLFLYYDQKTDTYILPNLKPTSDNFQCERNRLEELLEMQLYEQKEESN